MDSAIPEKRAGYELLIARLSQRFPGLEPIARAPKVMTITLIGFQPGVTLVGRRDEDKETGTYVTTLAVVLGTMPLCFLRAYRVLDWQLAFKQASNGTGEGTTISRWCPLGETMDIGPQRDEPVSCYFLGRVPLSKAARTLNVVVAVSVALLSLLILWH